MFMFMFMHKSPSETLTTNSLKQRDTFINHKCITVNIMLHSTCFDFRITNFVFYLRNIDNPKHTNNEKAIIEKSSKNPNKSNSE